MPAYHQTGFIIVEKNIPAKADHRTCLLVCMPVVCRRDDQQILPGVLLRGGKFGTVTANHTTVHNLQIKFSSPYT